MNLLGKSQWVRLVDVFVLGPFLIWFALESAKKVDAAHAVDLPTIPVWAVFGLFVSGVLTIVYNGANWLQIAGWVKS